MVLGQGDYTYRVQTDWAKLPLWWSFSGVTDIAIDSQDRVFVFDRMGDHPVAVFDKNGRFVSSWGEAKFRVAHEIYVDSHDFVWTADCGAHVVVKHSQGGKPIMELGERDVAGAAYYGQPFNMPTGMAVSSTGEVFVSDGYGNHKIQKFSPNGKHLGSWGTLGKGPGEFALPHCVNVDERDQVYVCDRENGRIQIFDKDGKYITEWGGMNLPESIDFDSKAAYVCEQSWGDKPDKVFVFSRDGKVVSSWST
ncbi:MAG: 6-bladed beta-propeller, partial [Thaumarchaeota archaeon]|nr:6-bladed beta-propeller [Nitrososphaerota archaeon]